MRYLASSVLALGLTIAPVAQAHVRVAPAQSQPGAQQTYTVRVPTEGMVTTTRVELMIPEGVHVMSAQDGGQLQQTGGHTVGIAWTVNIAPGQSQELHFVAHNPANVPQLEWKAHQIYVDGSRSDWVGPAGSRQPASITRLGPAAP